MPHPGSPDPQPSSSGSSEPGARWSAEERDLALCGRLLQRFGRRGGEALFEWLYARLLPWLHRAAARRGIPAGHDREAIAADVLVRLFMARREFRYLGLPAFRSWLAALLRTAISRRERGRRRPPLAPPGGADPCDGGRNDPLAVLERREEAGRILAAHRLLLLLIGQGLEAAPPAERTVLDLWSSGALEHPGSLARLGIGPGQAASLARRARDRVRRHVIRNLAAWK